ncbi:MAG: hypothetical protein AB7U73_22895 [Pirellulales bacterium]
MAVIYAADDHGRTRIVVENEPSFVVPLAIAPPGLEGELSNGKWLVVSMSIWNTHDIEAGDRAVALAKEQGGRITLGLRPFNDWMENATWIEGLHAPVNPDPLAVHVEKGNVTKLAITGTNIHHPLWVSFTDGKVNGLEFGLLSDDQIRGLMDRLL